MRSAFPDLQFVVEDTIAEGDKVVTRWTGHGTHRGRWQGVDSTGKHVSFSGVAIRRIAGGKVVERWVNVDYDRAAATDRRRRLTTHKGRGRSTSSRTLCRMLGAESVLQLLLSMPLAAAFQEVRPFPTRAHANALAASSWT